MDIQKASDSGSDKGNNDLEHVMDILIKFLKETPLSNKSNEQLLLILFSMLEMNKPQIDEIQQSRRLITAQYEEDILKSRKTGVLGGLFKRSKSKK